MVKMVIRMIFLNILSIFFNFSKVSHGSNILVLYIIIFSLSYILVIGVIRAKSQLLALRAKKETDMTDSSFKLLKVIPSHWV